MNNKLIWRGFVGSVLVCSLSGCSTIKSWFPDKERDYQFTSEIPELIVPEDLKHKAMLSPPRPTPAASTTDTPVSVDAVSREVDAAPIASSTAEPETSATTDQTSTETQTVASIANGASSLQIDQAKVPAIRMVGRALTRQKLEVTERNVDKGYFYVKFDPDAAQVSDDGFFDEFNFMFGDDPSQEQEYRITVHGLSPQMSEVIIGDNEGKLLSTPAANALLKLITEGINQVESQDSKTDQPAPDAETKNDTHTETSPTAEQPAPAADIPEAQAAQPAKQE